MPFIQLQNFSGIVPRTGPTQLDATQAQTANNVRETSKELRSWKKELFEYTPSNPSVQTIYKLYNISSGLYKWLEWSTDVDVVIGPVGDITESRIYYTGSGAPKKTNWNLATTSGTGSAPYPNAYYNMGVLAPAAAPTLVKSGGSGTVKEDRAYVYTNISTFGSVQEESAPSPATTVSAVEPNATVTVSGFSSVAVSGYNITSRRIYRSVAGTDTVSYLFVAEIPVATTSYADTLLAINLGSSLTSLYYTEPPSTLQGLVAMANGILAGFTGNQVWFCEPYLPHAWPSNYMLTVNDEIVGLGVYDSSVVVLTKHQPFVITGTSPGGMSQVKLPMMQPCVSKKSITTDQYGVLYASPNGLVSIGSGTQDVVTTALYTREEWQTLNPSSFVAKVYNNLWIGFYTAGGSTQAIVIARGDIPPLFTLNYSASALFIDNLNANIYAVSTIDNLVYKLDADTNNNTYYEWLSKKFVLPQPTNFGACKVIANFDYITDGIAYAAYVAAIIAANQTLFAAAGGDLKSTINGNIVNSTMVNGSILQDVPATSASTRSINIFVYADGKLIFTTGVTSPEPIRMPVATKSYVYEIKITGNTPVRGFDMATSIGELRTLGNG
jgi:hypothetical protein